MKKADFVKAIEDALGDDGTPLTPHGQAIAAGDGTLHGAIDYWQEQAFTMAAGQCCVKDGGLMADDHGHQYCDMERQRDELKAKLAAKPDVAGLVEAMKVTQFQVDEDGTNIGVSRQAVEEARTALAVQAHDIEAYRACLGYTVSGDHDGRLCDGTLPNNGIAQALSAQLQEKEAEYERLKAEKKMLVDTILASGMSAEVLQQSLDSARKESK